jgi:hypothetical protein
MIINSRAFLVSLCLAGLLAPSSRLAAADHGDTPVLGLLGRSDAQITDVCAFLRDKNLVLALGTNPAIPKTVTNYTFAPDLTATFHIDHHSRVRRDDPLDLVQFGGTIVRPSAVAEDVTFQVTFDDDGRPDLHTTGIAGKYRREIKLFAGLRDDPFIRKPRAGRNVAAIVIELPVEAVLGPQSELLIWATTKVPELAGPISEHGGRALRSMFNEPMNGLRPRDHWRVLDQTPDVMILDVLQASGFPNGREPTDDVIDLVVDIPGGTLPGEGPEFPTANDVPYLAAFPYLAPPHPAPAP